MIFSELASYVANRMKPDGDTIVDIPDSGPYISTSFGSEIVALLKQFSVESYVIYIPRIAITVQVNDREFSFSDPMNCSVDLVRTTDVWLNAQRLKRVTNYTELTLGMSPAEITGFPSRWMQYSPSTILFDRQNDESVMTDCYASGFQLFPTISSDNDVLPGIGWEHMDLLNAYIQCNLREFVSSDDVGAARLARLDNKRYERMKDIRLKQLTRSGANL